MARSRTGGRGLLGAVVVVLVAGVAFGGEAKPPPTEGEDVPEIVIKAKKPPVEQGEGSVFTAPLPRNVFERPLTESAGLDTATSIIGRQEIEWLEAYSAVDALKYVPGGWTERRGRKVKEFFSIRGQRYPYPDWAIEGAWFREFLETNYFFSAANIERIEVLRSASSLLISPGGMVGVVNIVPRTYTETETRIDAEYGSDETWRTHLSHGGMLADDISYALGIGHRHTDGPYDENAEENISSLYGRLVYTRLPDWTFSLSAFTICGDRELQLAEPPASKNLQTRKDSYDPMRTYVVVGKARYQASDNAATELTANFAQRRFHGYRVGAGAYRDRLEEDYEYGLKVIQTLRLSEANTLRFGGMAHQWVSPTGKRFYWGREGDIRTFSGVIVDEHDFGRLNLNAGYRLTRQYFARFGGFGIEGGASGGLANVQIEDEWEDPLHTVTVGGSYMLTDDLSLHSNLSWGQISARPGMLDQTTLDRPGTETRTKLDLGIQRAWDGFGQVGLTAFCVRQEDTPLLARGAETADGDWVGLYQSADRHSYGIELDVRTRRFPCGLQFFFNAVAMKTRDDRTGDWERDREVPEVICGGGVSYMPVSSLELALFTKHVGDYENERFLPGGSDPAPLGDFTELNAKVTYRFGERRQHYAYVGVDNLTNKHYSTVPGWPDEGRRVKAGVSLGF